MIFLGINLLSLVFDIYIIAWCPYKHCGYISVIETTRLLNLTMAHNITNESDLGAVQAVNLTIFDDWQKTVLTTSTASGTISYLFMIYVLYTQYSIFRKIPKKIKKWLRRCWEYFGEKLKPEITGVLQSLFIDSSGNTATKLSPKQSCYFMAIFSLNILVYIGSVALLFIIFAGSVDQRQKKNERIDASGLTFQFASQFCAILSCFIFSKVAYSVRTTCTQKLPELFNKVELAAAEHFGEHIIIGPLRDDDGSEMKNI